MKRLLLSLLLVLAAVPAQAQVTLTLDGYYDVQVDGGLTDYMQGLTLRHVNGEVRFFSLTVGGDLVEFVPTAGRITAVTARWNIKAVTGDHTGIWFEEATGRLWVTASVDYGDSQTYYPTRISTLTLGANGVVSNVKTVALQGITSKLIYGGCRALPAVLQVNGRKYGCGFGGYTSIAEQVSRAALGPFVVAIPDIAGYANGAEIPASAFTVLLDTPRGQRGVRKTLPINYFDGGDADANGVRRENPQTPPTTPPYSGAGYLSPNAQGLGWFIWGDSYYGNGEFIGSDYVAIAALGCGKGWYQGSTLHFDDRCAEVHTWPVSGLTGANVTQRPATMAVLSLPRGMPICTWDGNVPQCNVSGTAYDSSTGLLYAAQFPAADWGVGRVWRFRTGAATTPTPTPTPVPTPAPAPTPTPPSTPQLPAGAVRVANEGDVFTLAAPTVVYYGAGSVFVSTTLSAGSQSCSHGYGGSPATFPGGDPTPGIVKACYVAPTTATPPPAPAPTPTAPTISVTMTAKTCTLTLRAADAPDGTAGWAVQFKRNGTSHGSKDTSAPYERSADVSAGAYALTAIWTKSGQPTLTQALGTKACQ